MFFVDEVLAHRAVDRKLDGEIIRVGHRLTRDDVKLHGAEGVKSLRYGPRRPSRI